MNLAPNKTPHATFFLATIVSLLWVTVTIAQDLPVPQNATAILKELDKIDQGAKANENNRRRAAISQIQAAANSGSVAVDLYLRSLENTKYLESHQDYVDWSRKNQELLHSLSFQNAAQLQMRYLSMALQRDEKHDAFAQIPECLAYLEALASQKSLRSAGASSSSSQIQNQKTPIKTTSTDKPYPEALALINQPVDKSSVVEWFQISDLLPDKDFAPSAGNYQSIMEKNIRRSLKAMKDPRIIQTWDMQIAMETATATESNSKQQADAFNQIRLPYLLFSKAKDTAAIGQPNRALGEVMVLVGNYPQNPSMKDWITTARGLLTNLPTPVIGVPTATNLAATPTPTNSSAQGALIAPAPAH